jgi:uncharacterized membrane protein YdjX (TVP38/TMEM64 family)
MKKNFTVQTVLAFAGLILTAVLVYYASRKRNKENVAEKMEKVRNAKKTKREIAKEAGNIVESETEIIGV